MKTLVVLILLCIKYVNADYCLSDPVAERSPFTITQYVDKSDVEGGVFTWKYEHVNRFTVTAMTCDINNSPPCPSTSLYTGTMATSGSTKYKVTLTGKSMRRLRDQATWSWYGGNNANSIGQCDLPVYSFQSDPVCDENIQISSDGRNVFWTCIVDKVYPEMECLFIYRKGTSGNFMSVSSGHYASNKDTTIGDYPPRSVYHKYTCAMNLPINSFTGAGNYRFMFRGAVRVDVKGGVKTEFIESGPKTLTLALPQIELVDCPTPQDYIKEGDTKTCGCRIKTQGTPPGQPVWLNSNGNLVGNDVSNGVRYLSLKYNSQDQNPTYYCRGVSSIGNGPDVTYTPKFAYGPSQISVYFNSNNKVTNTINKCQETTSFTTYCDIAVVDVNPKPTMVLTSSDNSLITPQQESTVSGFYRYKYKVVPKGGGTPTITCQATNAIFSDLTTTKSKTITVQEPPLSRPVMTATISNKKQTVENGGIETLTSGDTVQFKCRVDGGFPLVSKVTTVCAGGTNVNDAAEATQTVIVKKEDNNKICSCKADHVTGCYDKTSEFTLDVQYTPSVAGYKANSESQKLTVSADETVTFVCDVEGNPRSTVSVKGQWSRETVTLSNTPLDLFSQRSTGTKAMSCKDTDEYRCVADNGVGDGVARTVAVFVECVPELITGFDQTVKLFSLINLKVTIPIIGYPEPKEYTLTKVGNQNRRKRSGVTGEVSKTFYYAIYEPGLPPRGEVVLRMFEMTGSDIGQYVLSIDNGIGKGFDYTFNITIGEVSAVDEEIGIGIGFGIGLAVGLVLCVICFFVGIKVQNMRSSREKEEASTQRMPQHSQQQPHREQQQQQQQQHHQHQQIQKQQVQEEEEEADGLHYQEIAEDTYEMLTVNSVSKASGRHRDTSQRNLYDVPKNSSQQQQQQHEKEVPSNNQQIQLDDNNTADANDTHQKKSQGYLNVTISSPGLDNPAHKNNTRPMASPGIYEGILSDPKYNEESAYVEADSLQEK